MTPPAVRLRRAAPADAPALARVMRAAIRGEAGRYPARLLAAWALPALYHRWAMGPGGETYLVAERGGRLLAYAAWRPGEVTALFVRPAAAGRGLGARLLARAEAAARAGGGAAPGRVTLLAARAAVPFYAARGWRAVRTARAPLPGGRWLPAVRMAKGGRRRGGSGAGAARRLRRPIAPAGAGPEERPPRAPHRPTIHRGGGPWRSSVPSRGPSRSRRCWPASARTPAG